LGAARAGNPKEPAARVARARRRDPSGCTFVQAISLRSVPYLALTRDQIGAEQYLPRVLSDFVADVTDAVADVRNRAARSVDDMFARLTGFVGDVPGRSTCTEHQATGQDRKQRVWKNRFCLHSP
jgi:hypothetical protein